MQDLTQGSITRHLLGMAAFIGFGLLFQTLYFLVDLYFVAHIPVIGKEAVAGVGTAGSLFFLVMAVTQLISVGALALISQATGRKDEADADLVYNQAMSLSALVGVVLLVVGYAFAGRLIHAVAADEKSAEQGVAYLRGFLPALALMFPNAAMGAALRATGVVKPTMMVQTISVLLNVALAPVLIGGLGMGVKLGAFGAGLASSIAGVVGFLVLLAAFPRVQSWLHNKPGSWMPRFDVWGRIIAIGFPAAGEFGLMFIVYIVVYSVLRIYGAHAAIGEGAAAQAGFSIGGRIMQSVFLPAMAVAFAAAPIAGQNYGAGRGDRVRETFRQAALIGSGIMLLLTVLCLLKPEFLIMPFTSEPKVVEVANGYLRIASLNFVAIGIVFACSGMFQALGNTWPALFSSAARVTLFTASALWLSTQPFLQLQYIWYLSAASITLQALVSFVLLRREFARKLSPAAAEPVAVTAAS